MPGKRHGGKRGNGGGGRGRGSKKGNGGGKRGNTGGGGGRGAGGRPSGGKRGPPRGVQMTAARSNQVYPSGEYDVESQQQTDTYVDNGKKKCLSPEQNKKFTQGMIIVGLIFGLISLIISIVAYEKLAAYASDFTAIIDSWERKPLYDAVLQNTPCDEGNNFFSASDYTWPGTHDMCDCGCCLDCNSTEVFTTRACESDETGCRDIPGIPPVTVSTLHDPNVNLCVRRRGKSALSRSVLPCKGSDMTCGSGDAKFCANKDDGCPITDLLLVQADTALSTQADEESSYTDPATGDEWVLYVKRGGRFDVLPADRPGDIPSFTTEGWPLIDAATQSAIPCYLGGAGYAGRSSEYSSMETQFILNMYDWTEGTGNYAPGYTSGYSVRRHLLSSGYTGYSSYTSYYNGGGSYGYCTDDSGFTTGYVLKTENDGGCDKRYDIRYQTMFARQEGEALEHSDDIPGAYKSSNSDYNLHMTYATETAWLEDEDSGCPTKARIKRNEDEVGGLLAAQTAMMVLAIMSFIVVGIIGGYYEHKWIGKDNDGVIKKGEPNYDNKQKCKYLKWLFKFGNYCCVIATIVYALTVLEIFIAVVDSGECTDDLTQGTFEKLKEIIQGLSNDDIINGAFSSFDSIGEVLLGVSQAQFS